MTGSSFYSQPIVELHLEPTDKCNARCPMCARRKQGGPLVDGVGQTDFSMQVYGALLVSPALSELQTLRLCGNLGDPILHPKLDKMIELAKSHWPEASIKLNTNGSIKSRDWWFDLGRFFQGKHDLVQFALDGFGEEFSRYRRGLSSDEVLKRAESFIRGGGRCQWVFHAFAHNEHQIVQAKKMSKHLGFESFVVKKTKRFFRSATSSWQSRFEVLDESGQVVDSLEPAKAAKHPLAVLESAQSAKEILSGCSITCRAKTRSSIYISAKGVVAPCCWVGGQVESDSSGALDLQEILKSHGGQKSLQLGSSQIEDILHGSEFLGALESSWDDSSGIHKRPRVCERICGQHEFGFRQQFEEPKSSHSAPAQSGLV